MTAQHTSDYPTLGEVLRLPAFAGCIVCGGAAGLDRQVSGVNLTDTPDYARWLAQRFIHKMVAILCSLVEILVVGNKGFNICFNYLCHISMIK